MATPTTTMVPVPAKESKKAAVVVGKTSKAAPEKKVKAKAGKAEVEEPEKKAKKGKAEAAPEKKAKKGATKSRSNLKDGEMFREGSTKAHVWNLLKGGKATKRETLNALVEKEGKTTSLIHWVLVRAAEEGYKVKSEEGMVTVTKK